MGNRVSLHATGCAGFRIRGPGPRAWGARGPTLRAALKLTKCMANILCVKLYNLLAAVPREVWGPLHPKPWALAP